MAKYHIVTQFICVNTTHQLASCINKISSKTIKEIIYYANHYHSIYKRGCNNKLNKIKVTIDFF